MDGLLILEIVLGLALITGLGVAAARVTSMHEFRSAYGNWQVYRVLKHALPASHYSVFRDVKLPADGGLVVIDHLVISPYGIFVIETQHLSGWIFGSTRDATWTQATRHSQTPFANPMRDNYSHIKALENVLTLERPVYHSVVVFTGEAKFESQLPSNVTQTGGLPLYIQCRTESVMDFDDLPVLVAKVKAAQLKGQQSRPVKRAVTAWSEPGEVPAARH